MSLKGLDLFQLLPALYRLKDAQVAQSQALLTPVEQTQLAALQALIPPLSADQQAELDQLTAKAARGPLQSLLMLVEEQLAVLSENLDQLYGWLRTTGAFRRAHWIHWDGSPFRQPRRLPFRLPPPLMQAATISRLVPEECTWTESWQRTMAIRPKPFAARHYPQKPARNEFRPSHSFQ